MLTTETTGKALKRLFLLPLCLTGLLVASTVHANPAAMPIEEAAESKPFADARVALQISDTNPFKQTLVLNVASNLLKHYGRDKVDVEIVAFGPGLRLLFEDNAQSERIARLTEAGVRFSACENTINNMAKKLGHTPALNPNAGIVPAGIVRLVRLDAAGYFVAKP